MLVCIVLPIHKYGIACRPIHNGLCPPHKNGCLCYPMHNSGICHIVGQFLHDMGEIGIVDDKQVFQDMMLSTFHNDTIFEKEQHEEWSTPQQL